MPVVYEGMDEACSICQHAFAHGDRVCRLSCRHMFHANCWGAAMGSAALDNQPRASCPNCRGSGTLIAVWSYIDPTRVTQIIHGILVPNVLDSDASYHSMSTPVLTPRSARSRADSFTRAEVNRLKPEGAQARTTQAHTTTHRLAFQMGDQP